MTAIRWDSIHDAIVKEYARMNNGKNIDGWTSSAIADAVCYRLRDVGVNVLDIPANCMEGDPRLLPAGHPSGYPAPSGIQIKQLDGTVMIYRAGASYRHRTTGEVLRLVRIEATGREASALFLTADKVEVWKDASWNFHLDYEQV